MCALFHNGSNIAVGEPQREQVLDRLLAEIMVDPEHPLLGKGRGDGVVDLAARFEVAAERLFERHPHRRASEPGRGEPVDRRLEQRRRGREENRDAVARIADRFGKPLETRGIVDVERHVMQPRAGSAAAIPSWIEARRQMLLRSAASALLAKGLVIERRSAPFR